MDQLPWRRYRARQIGQQCVSAFESGRGWRQKLFDGVDASHRLRPFARWQARANLSSSQGAFRNLSDVAFGDGELRFLTTNEDMLHLRVVVKRGRELSWVESLVPDPETRRSLAIVHDPSGKTKEVADIIRIEVQLPEAVVASGVQPAGRGIEAAHERNRAYLLLPVEVLLEPGEDLVWDIGAFEFVD